MQKASFELFCELQWSSFTGAFGAMMLRMKKKDCVPCDWLLRTQSRGNKAAPTKHPQEEMQ